MITRDFLQRRSVVQDRGSPTVQSFKFNFFLLHTQWNTQMSAMPTLGFFSFNPKVRSKKNPARFSISTSRKERQRLRNHSLPKYSYEVYILGIHMYVSMGFLILYLASWYKGSSSLHQTNLGILATAGDHTDDTQWPAMRLVFILSQIKETTENIAVASLVQ